MERLTKSLEGNSYIVEDNRVQHNGNGYSGDAIDKLARFENIYDDLVSKQKTISEDLENLRFEGKTHSVKFRQLLTDKIASNNILILFRNYGL